MECQRSLIRSPLAVFMLKMCHENGLKRHQSPSNNNANKTEEKIKNTNEINEITCNWRVSTSNWKVKIANFIVKARSFEHIEKIWKRVWKLRGADMQEISSNVDGFVRITNENDAIIAAEKIRKLFWSEAGVKSRCIEHWWYGEHIVRY